MQFRPEARTEAVQQALIVNEMAPPEAVAAVVVLYRSVAAASADRQWPEDGDVGLQRRLLKSLWRHAREG
jgi:hypothetical protein